MNIILYDSKEGNERLEPFIDIWFDCIYIPAIAGPIAIPIKKSIAVIPKDIPIESFGVYSRRIFQLPILVSVNPIAIIARFADIKNSDEWNRNKLKNPKALTIVPTKVGFIFPNFEIIIPAETDTIRIIMVKGIWTFAALIAFPPKPNGGGLSNEYRNALIHHKRCNT